MPRQTGCLCGHLGWVSSKGGNDQERPGTTRRQNEQVRPARGEVAFGIVGEVMDQSREE